MLTYMLTYKLLLIPQSKAAHPHRSTLCCLLFGCALSSQSESLVTSLQQQYTSTNALRNHSIMVKNRGMYFGEYEKPVHEQVSEQALHNVAGRGHVLVRVHAVSLNPVDAKGVIGDKLAADWTRLRKLSHNWMVKNTRVGFDFAGEVVEGQDPFNKGAKVYGTMPPFQGSFAEYIRVPRHQIALAPTNISMDEAACLPLVGLTGWQALSPQVKPGQSSVLIVGGSGGTGHVAIQIANALGAKSVTVICSTRNIEFVKLCGATNVVDYAKENDIIEALQRQMVEPFDVILDCVSSGDPRDASYNYPERVQHASDPPLVAKNYLYLRLGGKWSDWIRAGLARPGIFPHSWLWKDDRERLFWIKFPKSAAGLEELTTLVEGGKLRVHIQKVYPEMAVDTVQQAMDDLLSRRAQGKVAIRVSPPEVAD